MTFLKWAGSKRTIISDIQSVLKDYPKSRFLEPFVGGGSVFSSIGNGYDEVVINDLNKNLISVYKNLQEIPSKFIADCELLFTNSNNTKDAFNAIKAQYNELVDGSYDKLLFSSI